MAWIKLDQSLCKHRKVMCMSDMLDEQDAHIIGHLSLLWIWCLDNAPTGVLPSSNRIISRAAQYLGDADSFFSALETSGLVDINEDGLRSIHDWFDFAGALIDKRAANRNRMCNARAMHNNSTCGERTGARVEKSRVEKNKEKQAKDTADKPPDLFSEFWQLYPKKVSKPRAFTAFADQKITQVDMDVIITQIRDLGNLTADERKKIPAANIYLKERRWEGNEPFVGLDIYREQSRNGHQNSRMGQPPPSSTDHLDRIGQTNEIPEHEKYGMTAEQFEIYGSTGCPPEVRRFLSTIAGHEWRKFAADPAAMADVDFAQIKPPPQWVIDVAIQVPKWSRDVRLDALPIYEQRKCSDAAV